MTLEKWRSAGLTAGHDITVLTPLELMRHVRKGPEATNQVTLTLCAIDLVLKGLHYVSAEKIWVWKRLCVS